MLPAPKFWNLLTEASNIRSRGKLVMEYCLAQCHVNISGQHISGSALRRVKEDYVFEIATINHSVLEHKTLTKDAVCKKSGKIIDVDNKLAMDAVFGNNMEAFPESDD
jgi:hypothetical protein